MRYSKGFVGLEDLYVAFRKAKSEAFHESTHFHAEAFSRYEQRLDSHLRRLLSLICDPGRAWTTDGEFLGHFEYAAKSVEEPTYGDSSHFRNLDPIADWKSRFEKSGRRSEANFRLVIVASVDLQVISALWIVKVGYKFDACVDSRHSYGNRLRLNSSPRTFGEILFPPVNLDCQGLFKPYFSAYRTWRERGLKAMRSAVSEGRPIIAITMDIRQFYHNASPSFLTNKSFLQRLELDLTVDEQRLTSDLVAAMQHWYSTTPDFKARPEGGIPVGLSASKIIANVLLVGLDRAILQHAKPVYYGRYVDDLFVVLNLDESLSSGVDLMRWFSKNSGGVLEFSEVSAHGPCLKVIVPEAPDAELLFVGKKQKVFALTSKHGLDLIEQISEQIRQQSSEHRLLPELPETDVEMATRALLAVPDTTLESDSLRKTEAVSIRRLGFSLLLRDVEAFAKDLSANRWKLLRHQFYGLVQRHLLTPKGFFDYAGYLHRVFGLMVACRDLEAAEEFLNNFDAVREIIESTTTAGTRVGRERFSLCIQHYVRGFVQASIQASTARHFAFGPEFTKLLAMLRSLSPAVPIPRGLVAAKAQSQQMLITDWGRRPYKDYWYFDQNADIKGPPVPKSLEVRKVLRLGGIRAFRKGADLKVPYWPALAFPTRPLTVAEISIVAPRVLENAYRFRRAVMSLRGAHVHRSLDIGFREREGVDYLEVPNDLPGKVRIAITNIETTDAQWDKAARQKHDLSLSRYKRLHRLVNQVMADPARPNYVVFPECSLPKRWALSIAAKLAQSGISLLAGLEYHRDRKDRRLRNDCLVSLATPWPYYVTNIVWLQPKAEPAHGEKLLLKEHSEVLHTPRADEHRLPVYRHGHFFFSALLCSDLTNIENRQHLQGAIDALFVLEWNKDINTFSFLVEASAHDIHTFVVQVNNRRYGDSRLRTPLEDVFRRDAVRLKGGATDYFVVTDVDFAPLRSFQARRGRGGKGFKPLPIGFQMSQPRKDDSNGTKE